METHLVRSEDSLIDLLSSEALVIDNLQVQCTFALDTSQKWIVDLVTASVEKSSVRVSFSNGFSFHRKGDLCIMILS